MSKLLYRLGRNAFRHRLRFLAAWLVLLSLGGGYRRGRSGAVAGQVRSRAASRRCKVSRSQAM